jgi:hypothetical protein
VTADGQNIPISTNVVNYYAKSNGAFLGEVRSGTSIEYDVAHTPIDFPTMIVPGSAGTLGAMSRSSDETMNVSLGTAQLSYSVPQSSVDPGSPLLVVLTTTFYDTTNTLTETDTMIYNLANDATLTFGTAEFRRPPLRSSRIRLVHMPGPWLTAPIYSGLPLTAPTKAPKASRQRRASARQDP